MMSLLLIYPDFVGLPPAAAAAADGNPWKEVHFLIITHTSMGAFGEFFGGKSNGFGPFCWIEWNFSKNYRTDPVYWIEWSAKSRVFDI